MNAVGDWSCAGGIWALSLWNFCFMHFHLLGSAIVKQMRTVIFRKMSCAIFSFIKRIFVWDNQILANYCSSCWCFEISAHSRLSSTCFLCSPIFSYLSLSTHSSNYLVTILACTLIVEFTNFLSHDGVTVTLFRGAQQEDSSCRGLLKLTILLEIVYCVLALGFFLLHN